MCRKFAQPSLASQIQVERLQENIERLKKSQEVVYGDLRDFDVVGAQKDKGAFVSPTLFLNKDPLRILLKLMYIFSPIYKKIYFVVLTYLF